VRSENITKKTSVLESHVSISRGTSETRGDTSGGAKGKGHPELVKGRRII